MCEVARDKRHGPGQRFGAHFWKGVEREIARLDADDFASFLAADAWDVPSPRPGFRDALLVELLADLRRRRAH